MPSFRLGRVANLLTVSTAEIVNYLRSLGHEVDNSPIAEITEEQFELLKTEFSNDPADKVASKRKKRNPLVSSSSPGLKTLEALGAGRKRKRKRKVEHLDKLVVFDTNFGTSDFDLEDKEALYLGTVEREFLEKGFGFIRKIGSRTDVWFHVSYINGKAIDSEELLVFTVRESIKHPGKIEAPWVQAFSEYLPEPDLLKTWYDLYPGAQLRRQLLSKMSLKGKIDALKKNLDVIIARSDDRIESSLTKLTAEFFPLSGSNDDEKQLVVVADEYIGQSATSLLQFSWWLIDFSKIAIPLELITSKLLESEPSLQVQVFNRATVEKRPALFEGFHASAGIEALLTLKKEKLPSSFESDLDNFIKSKLSFSEEANLFFAEKWNQVDINYLLLNYQKLDARRLLKVVQHLAKDDRVTENFLCDLVKIHLNHHSGFAKEIVDQLSMINRVISKYNEELAELIRSTLANEAPRHLHCSLWENRLIDSATDAEKKSWLTSANFALPTLEFWIDALLIDQQEFQNLLQFAITSYPPISSRPQFYGFHDLLARHKHQTTSFRPENQVFFKLSRWLTDPDLHSLEEEINQKLIFLKPEHQILMLKKRFHLHETGITHLSIEDLQLLRHIDLNLYQTAAEVAPELSLDLSVATVIHTLQSLAKDAKLLVSGDLIVIMLENITSDRTQKFKITELFEACAGRMEMDYDWATGGRKLFKVAHDDTYYWAFEILYNDAVVEEIRALPVRRWNIDRGHWGVPAKYKEDVLKLARDNNFFIDIEGSNYTNNTHLASAKRTKQPRGITYCEGRKVDILHRTHQKEYWWCANAACFQNCETVHPPADWKEYTVLDFCRILDLKIDDQDVAGQIVSKSEYYKFIAIINRFNRLIEHLYCRECDEILSPTTETHFGARRISRFQCTKPACSAHHKEVYLHHCLNGKCNSIIDSRDSKKCPHGLFICTNEECGTCCSHKMFSDRLSNLNKTGGIVSLGLLKNVNNSEGHQERGEHFCYSCGEIMDKYSGERYHCTNCEVTYKLAGNRFERPHAGLSPQVEKPGDPPS